MGTFDDLSDEEKTRSLLQFFQHHHQFLLRAKHHCSYFPIMRIITTRDWETLLVHSEGAGVGAESHLLLHEQLIQKAQT